MSTFTSRPSPSPYDEYAWTDVLIVSGGLGMVGSPLSREVVLEHWRGLGLPAEDAEHFLANPPESNTFYNRPDGSSVAFTVRACDDVQRIAVVRHNCRTCTRATPGKVQYHDPEFFCDGRLNPGETKKGKEKLWSAAWLWQQVALPRRFKQIDATYRGAPPAFSAILEDDADGCPWWAEGTPG